MTKYRKLCVDVDALKFENVEDVITFLGDSYAGTTAADHVMIDTGHGHGVVNVAPGDYVVRDVAGCCYPVAAKVFGKTHELVES